MGASFYTRLNVDQLIDFQSSKYFLFLLDNKTQKYSFSKCLLRHDVVRVFVSFLVLVFVRANLSWCP